MTGRAAKRIGPGTVFVALFAAAGPGHADPPRTRTLTYDAKQKSWAELPPPPPGTPEGDLHLIRVAINEGRYRSGRSAIKEFVKTYGESDATYPQVLLAQADLLIRDREYDKAHKVLETFLSRFGGMAATEEALRLKFVIADVFLSGVKRKVWGVRWLPSEDLALRILDEISTDYPESPLAELAVKTKADYLFNTGDHGLAELEYARLLKDYAQSRYQRFAMLQTAESALAGFRGIDFDDAGLIEASERYSDYLARWPADADRERIGLIQETIREQRAEKELTIGHYYERTDHLSSAIFYFRSVVENWPDTIAATKARDRLELLGAT